VIYIRHPEHPMRSAIIFHCPTSQRNVRRIMDILISLLHKNNTTWMREFVTGLLHNGRSIARV
jgi:hypothetical protein